MALFKKPPLLDSLKNEPGIGDSDDQKILNRLKVRGALLNTSKTELEKILKTEESRGLYRTVQESDHPSIHPKPEKDFPLDSDIIAATQYRLSATDAFVEKAQFHLETRAVAYRVFGIILFTVCLCVLGVGARVAFALFIEPNPAPRAWLEFAYRFTVSFTAYGLLVATAVAAGRGAKACFDQTERLLAKRHALRHGRLFLHLRGGIATSAQMKEAFDWNHFQPNAFTNLNLDTKAPWGSVADELAKSVQAGVEAAAKVEK